MTDIHPLAVVTVMAKPGSGEPSRPRAGLAPPRGKCSRLRLEFQKVQPR
jgi:hypothetical protein